MTEKNEIFEKIKEKYAKTSQISERTMQETAETLMGLAEKKEMSIDDVLETIGYPLLDTVAGQLRKDVADAIREAEDKKPKSEASRKEVEKPSTENQEKPENETPEWVQAILDKFTDYDKRFENEDKQKKAERARISAFSKAKNLYPQNVIDVAADGFDFTQEEAENVFVEKVNRVASKVGVTPQKAAAPDDAPDFSAFNERLKERGLISESKN